MEGIEEANSEKKLNEIYTALYITDVVSEEVKDQHEVRQMEVQWKVESNLESIEFNDIFKARNASKKPRTVMTKGIAGIGKSVAVQKFRLDWKDGRANKDVDFIFLLPFRQLNLFIDNKISLYDLLLTFHPQLRGIHDVELLNNAKIIFILDGLDEFKFPLKFAGASMTNLRNPSTVDVLIVNLVRATLLPSALIWVTSRPAAAHQIPARYVDRWTEIQGFKDKEKKQYFRNKIHDETIAGYLLSRIENSRHLYIMCRIPVFCWILATVILKKGAKDKDDIPKTLTEIYAHFLLIQCTRKEQKNEDYEDQDVLKTNKDLILKLAELAYRQLEEDNILFREEDLEECRIDIHQDLEKSGMCREVFVSERLFSKQRVYCFVHLSIQEFMAALFVVYSFSTGNFEVLKSLDMEGQTLHHLLQSAVRKSLQSRNGHLDLFLRFLLGMSLECNQKLFGSLLAGMQESKESIKHTVQYIKDSLSKRNQSTERCMNLMLCLLELKDSSLQTEIEAYKKSKKILSPALCSAIAYMMLVAEETPDEFDMMSYNTTDKGRLRLVTAVRGCKRGRLVNCGLDKISCKTISSALESESCSLKELELSCNDLGDDGVQELSNGLLHRNCKLETLRLASCNLTGSSYKLLSSALEQPESNLRELDLTNNNLTAEGVQLLAKSQLNKLILAGCNLTGDSWRLYQLSSTSHLIHLDLTNNDLGEPGVDKLSEALSHHNCKLEILKLSGCLVSEKACEVLVSVLTSKSTCLKELDLSYNHTGHSGVSLRSKLQQRGCQVIIDPNTEQWMEQWMKPGLQKYACELSLDIYTAHPELKLSEDKRSVTKGEEEMDYPDRPQRFDVCPQLLCAQGLTGRHYWEADWSGPEVVIGVAYESLERKAHGASCKIGLNTVSYGLWCEGGQLSVRYNLNKTNVPVPKFDCSRIGLYLDWPAGTLSFYAVSSETLFHLHTFHSRVGDPPHPGFPEPLYPGFWLQDGSTVSLRQVT
ncbi:hypothetical protein ACEWY4_027651 [Coilia grayii]|uniref:Uncharacterized protein n=1 Tax=Coilia grayii TaxID=363190 RepID=A0ABD1IS27_9TELE